MKRITGTWVDSRGNAAAYGTLHAKLNQDAVVINTSQTAPRSVEFQLNANGSLMTGAQIWANDELSPDGTWYTLVVNAYGGGVIWGPFNVRIVGRGPINLTGVAPVNTIPPVATPGNLGGMGMIDATGNATMVTDQFLIAAGSNVTLSNSINAESMTVSIIAGGGAGTDITSITTGLSSLETLTNLVSVTTLNSVSLVTTIGTLSSLSSLTNLNSITTLTGVTSLSSLSDLNSLSNVGSLSSLTDATSLTSLSALTSLSNQHEILLFAGNNNITVNSSPGGTSAVSYFILGQSTTQVTSLTTSMASVSNLTSLTNVNALTSLSSLTDASSLTSLSNLTNLQSSLLMGVGVAAGGEITFNGTQSLVTQLNQFFLGAGSGISMSFTTGHPGAGTNIAGLTIGLRPTSSASISVAGGTNISIAPTTNASGSTFAVHVTGLNTLTSGQANWTTMGGWTSLGGVESMTSLSSLTDASSLVSLSYVSSLSNQSQVYLVAGSNLSISTSLAPQSGISYGITGSNWGYLTSITNQLASLTSMNFNSLTNVASLTTNISTMVSFSGTLTNVTTILTEVRRSITSQFVSLSNVGTLTQDLTSMTTAQTSYNRSLAVFTGNTNLTTTMATNSYGSTLTLWGPPSFIGGANAMTNSVQLRLTQGANMSLQTSSGTGGLTVSLSAIPQTSLTFASLSTLETASVLQSLSTLNATSLSSLDRRLSLVQGANITIPAVASNTAGSTYTISAIAQTSLTASLSTVFAPISLTTVSGLETRLPYGIGLHESTVGGTTAGVGQGAYFWGGLRLAAGSNIYMSGNTASASVLSVTLRANQASFIASGNITINSTTNTTGTNYNLNVAPPAIGMVGIVAQTGGQISGLSEDVSLANARELWFQAREGIILGASRISQQGMYFVDVGLNSAGNTSTFRSTAVLPPPTLVAGPNITVSSIWGTVATGATTYTSNLSIQVGGIGGDGGGGGGASRYLYGVAPIIPSYTTWSHMWPTAAASCVLWPLQRMAPGNYTAAGMMSHFTHAATGAQTAQGGFTMSLGFYTRNGSTLTRMSSASTAYTWVLTANANLTNYNLLKMLKIPITANFDDNRDYWAGFCLSTSSAGQGSWTASGIVYEGGMSGGCAGEFGQATNNSNQRLPFWGNYQGANSLPASVVGSQISGTSATLMRVPVMWMMGFTV